VAADLSTAAVFRRLFDILGWLPQCDAGAAKAVGNTALGAPVGTVATALGGARQRTAAH
jgi:hypothetical protein